MQIRKAKLSDIELLESLACQIWNECYPGIISQEQINYMLKMMYSGEIIEKEMEKGIHWYLLEDNGTPAGFLSFKEEPDSSIKLNKLYALASTHGKGYGQKALDFVIKFAEQNGFANVFLTVNKNNLKAMKAYERYGLVKTDSVVNDIGNGYVMDDFIYSFRIKK